MRDDWTLCDHSRLKYTGADKRIIHSPTIWATKNSSRIKKRQNETGQEQWKAHDRRAPTARLRGVRHWRTRGGSQASKSGWRSVQDVRVHEFFQSRVGRWHRERQHPRGSTVQETMYKFNVFGEVCGRAQLGQAHVVQACRSAPCWLHGWRGDRRGSHIRS